MFELFDYIMHIVLSSGIKKTLSVPLQLWHKFVFYVYLSYVIYVLYIFSNKTTVIDIN